jgi:hypothetical protein
VIDCDERPGHALDRRPCGEWCRPAGCQICRSATNSGDHRGIEGQIAPSGTTLLRPDRRDERARHGDLGGVRQWIESIFDTLKGQLGSNAMAAAPARVWAPHRATTAHPASVGLAQLEHSRTQ